MAAPAVQRVHIVVTQRKDDAHRRRVEIEVIEEAVFLRDQARNRLGDSALKKDGEGVADFVLGPRPLCAPRENLLELIKNKMGDVRDALDGPRKQSRRTLGDDRPGYEPPSAAIRSPANPGGSCPPRQRMFQEGKCASLPLQLQRSNWRTKR
jgi:hypothetical protein